MREAKDAATGSPISFERQLAKRQWFLHASWPTGWVALVQYKDSQCRACRLSSGQHNQKMRTGRRVAIVEFVRHKSFTTGLKKGGGGILQTWIDGRRVDHSPQQQHRQRQPASLLSILDT
jgi:hypothetical protein